MKLRNRKTGEIKDLSWVINHLENDKDTFTLAELNKEWEDYKEKEYFYLNMDGDIRHTANQAMVKYSKEIGNYFETEEEAEKAVEKLKAWKRLRDKGLRFNDWHARLKNGVTIYARYDEGDEIVDDLNTLFGSEE